MNVPAPLFCLALLFPLAGCASDPAPNAGAEPVEKPEEKDAKPSLNDMTEAEAEEKIIDMAKEDVAAMTQACQRYMEGAQTVSPEEPWHQEGVQGEPLPQEKHVFPGGASYTFSTHSEPPFGRTPIAPQMQRDAQLEATLAILGTPLTQPLHYKLTYETFSEDNGDTLCTAKAELQVISDRPEDRKEVSQSARYIGSEQSVVLTPITLAP